MSLSRRMEIRSLKSGPPAFSHSTAQGLVDHPLRLGRDFRCLYHAHQICPQLSCMSSGWQRWPCPSEWLLPPGCLLAPSTYAESGSRDHWRWCLPRPQLLVLVFSFPHVMLIEACRDSAHLHTGGLPILRGCVKTPCAVIWAGGAQIMKESRS